MSAGESGDVGARPEDVRSRPLGAQTAAGSPPVDSINILARALSSTLEGSLAVSMEGFWSRLDAKLASLAPPTVDGSARTGTGDVPPPSGVTSACPDVGAAGEAGAVGTSSGGPAGAAALGKGKGLILPGMSGMIAASHRGSRFKSRVGIWGIGGRGIEWEGSGVVGIGRE